MPRSHGADGPADDALRNIDNVYTMRDGRVLCCEDGFGGPARSYPNDGLYVYRPNVVVDVDSLAVGSGATGTARLRMNGAPAGLSGAEITVSLTDPDVARIADVDFPDALGLTKLSIADDGSQATLRVTDVDRSVQPGSTDVTLAELSVRGTATGTTDVELSAHRAEDESGDDIAAEARTGLVVVGPPRVPGAAGPPTDPDGDAEFEDVNGNGRVDYDDVVLLFEAMNSDAVRLNASAYDFNDNGKLDFDDVVELYEEV